LYTVQRRKSQYAAAILVAALSCAGCASTDFGRGEITASTPKAIASAASARSPEFARAPGDWETVRSTVIAAVPNARSTARSGPLAWENKQTGNSGRISDVIASVAGDGTPCRGFSTTVSSIDGVRLYRGEVCQQRGNWELVTVEPADLAPAKPGG
jgi:hypothetical protein